ncbi:hypothetical protein D3C78_20540 [compost metagenome]
MELRQIDENTGILIDSFKTNILLMRNGDHILQHIDPYISVLCLEATHSPLVYKIIVGELAGSMYTVYNNQRYITLNKDTAALVSTKFEW